MIALPGGDRPSVGLSIFHSAWGHVRVDACLKRVGRPWRSTPCTRPERDESEKWKGFRKTLKIRRLKKPGLHQFGTLDSLAK